jgi:Cof subfamily protein (haloacid dehalogenase superfamily)
MIDPTNVKLLAFDLDGTLIVAHQGIFPYTKKVLTSLRQRGVLITIATGRILPAVIDYANDLEIDIPMILSNGSVLQNRRGEVTSHTRLPLDVVLDTIQTTRRLGCDMLIYIRDSIYIEHMTDNVNPVYGEMVGGKYEIGSWESIADKLPDANKCVIVDTKNEQNLVEAEAALREMLNGRAVTLRSSRVLLEVQPKDVTKATGLRRLADALSIGVDQVIAFGDYDNDAEMLKAAGLGVAVGNATPACLANADLVIAGPEEEGAAHFLEEFFA